jgi:hypothetical protein
MYQTQYFPKTYTDNQNQHSYSFTQSPQSDRYLTHSHNSPTGRSPKCNPESGEVSLYDYNKVWLANTESVVSRDQVIALVQKSVLKVGKISNKTSNGTWALMDNRTISTQRISIYPGQIKIMQTPSPKNNLGRSDLLGVGFTSDS